MHKSWLSYNLERPYPCRWLTPVVVVGGLVFLVLFSFLKYASSGFSLVVQYSSDPNSTSELWFGSKLPALLTSKLKAQCQSTSIPGQTDVFTKNTALTYQIESVQSADGTLLSSLIYSNNLLQNCSVNSVKIDLDRTGRPTGQTSSSPWGITTSARITCNILLPTPGLTTVNLTSVWDPFSGTTPPQVFFGRNATDKASLYWGEALLRMHYTEIEAYLDSHYQWHVPFANAFISFSPRSNVSDITSLDYYLLDWRAIRIPGDGTLWVDWFGGDVMKHHVDHLATTGEEPNIWIAADSLTKSFQSTILTDLGQIGPPLQPNILVDAAQLEHFTSNFSNILKMSDDNYHLLGQEIELARTDYNSAKDKTGPLVVNPSTFATNYLCNVPQRKPLGSLIVAILVADLILMQTLWLLFKLTVGVAMRRQNSKAD